MSKEEISYKVPHEGIGKISELFSPDVHEPVGKHTNSAENATRKDEDTNINVNSSNSIISHDINTTRRGIKRSSTTEEKISQNENEGKPNELQNRPRYNETKQRKTSETSTSTGTPLKFDSEALNDPKKLNDSDTKIPRKKKEEIKLKKCTDLQKKPYTPSKFSSSFHSKMKISDTYHDKVSPVVKKSTSDSKVKRNLDLSPTKKIHLENKEKRKSKLEHSPNKSVFKIKELDGNGSKTNKGIVETQYDDSDETLRVILRGFGKLFLKIGLGTLKEPSSSTRTKILDVAHLLLDL